MADQNITALPVATSPTSSDQLLLVGATEEKLIDYDKLADAILILCKTASIIIFSSSLLSLHFFMYHKKAAISASFKRSYFLEQFRLYIA